MVRYTMSCVCDLNALVCLLEYKAIGTRAMPVYPLYCHLSDAVYDLTLQSSFDIVHHQHLDTRNFRVCTQIQRVHRVLQGKSMRNQFLQVQNPAAHTRNRWRPGVAVAVDEPEIDLSIVSMFSSETRG